MIKLNYFPNNAEPRNKINQKFNTYFDEKKKTHTFMDFYESAFLCGMLKQKQPKKILEVGVAGGGTTSIILQALEDLGKPYEMHSTDISETFYVNKSKLTGFVATIAKENNLLITPPPVYLVR